MSDHSLRSLIAIAFAASAGFKSSCSLIAGPSIFVSTKCAPWKNKKGRIYSPPSVLNAVNRLDSPSGDTAVKCFLTGLLCVLAFNSLVIAQEQPETPRPAGQGRGRGGPPTRPEPPTAGRQITLDVLIADLAVVVENPTAPKILELVKAGNLRAVTWFRMITLDEQPGFVQFGGQPASRNTGFGDRGGPGGPRVPTASNDGGARLQATTRIEEGGTIVMQIFLERPDSVVPAALTGPDVATEDVKRRFFFLTQGTVRLRSGEPAVIGSRSVAAGTDITQTVAVVTATVER